MYTLGIAGEYPFDMLILNDVKIFARVPLRFVSEDLAQAQRHPSNESLIEELAQMLWLANLGETIENKPDRARYSTVPLLEERP